MKELTAKLAPLAIKTTLETDFVPPPQGTTHWPDASLAVHDDPGPWTGSYPAVVASDWNKVIEYPSGPTPFIRTIFQPQKVKARK